MKKKLFLLPFALTSLAFALSGCGGESTTVHEDPYRGVPTTGSGCTPSNSSDKCLGFYVDYPVENLNFDCSSDTKSHFATVADGNTVMGGCLKEDKVKFYIQGVDTSRQIALGEVDLKKLRPLYVQGQIVPIRLVDIATAMTGKDIVQTNLSDDTYRVYVNLVRILQAAGVHQQAHLSGDLQQISLTDNLKNQLKVLDSDVTVKNLLDDSYINILKPWIDVSTVPQTDAEQVADQLVKLSNVNVYTANFFTLKTENADYGGFHGSAPSGKESIANLYLLTDRSGYTQGYSVQWAGVPLSTGTNIPIIGSAFGRMNLLVQVAPSKLNTITQQNWINPLTKKIINPLNLKTNVSSNEQMSIYQGTIFNDTTIPGNDYVYQSLTGDKNPPTDKTVLGKWRQTLNGENFDGSIDIFKSSPATQLNNQIFTTKKNVDVGKKYIFPLYANLTFNFTDSVNNPNPVTLGIVVDENGDIRTNMTSPTDLKGSTCNGVDSNLTDQISKVQQYRIGTTGAANYETADKTLTLRMILANPVFGNIDGAIIGLNENLITPQVTNDGSFQSANSSGVRINLQNLIVSQDVSKGINITGWSSSSTASQTASWVNMLAVAQVMYNTSNKDKVSADQKALATRQSGTLNIKLLDCYQLQTKN